MTALLDAIAAHARSNAAGVAIEGADGWLSWSDVYAVVRDASRRLAGLFSRPVGLMLDHSPASLLLTIALIEAGVPQVALPLFFTPDQRRHALADAGADALITDCSIDGGAMSWTWESTGAAPVELPPGTSLVTYTSGSTGDPKGVCLSADHLVATAQAVVDFLGQGHAGRHLSVLPFGVLLESVAGQFASIIAGGTTIVLPAAAVGLAEPFRPRPAELLAALVTRRVTSLILVPEYLAMLVAMLEASGINLPDLTLVAVGGAPVPGALLDRAFALGLPVRQGYGLTETGSVVTLEDQPGTRSTGVPVGAHRISIADDGEVMIDGPLFLGTVGRPRSRGPLATGDLGELDTNGRLRILGRKSNLIITAFGRNVSPEWVEQALTAQPEILQAMVRNDGQAALEALIVPASPTACVAAAIARANAQLPDYAQIATNRLVPPFTPANGQLTGNGRLRRAAIDRAYGQTEADQSFFDRLVTETREAQARFAMTPQLIAGLTGAISRSDYLAYLGQAYHHVSHTVPLMQAARARLVERGDAMLVEALDDYIKEEAGHENWILDDIVAAGGNRCTTVLAGPAPATKAMVDHAYATIETGNPAAFFGMVFVLEGTSTAMATTGATAVQRTLGLPQTAFRYLTSHGALDLDHMKFFEGLMNLIDDPADQQAIIAMAKDMFGLFGDVFGSIELEGARHAA